MGIRVNETREDYNTRRRSRYADDSVWRDNMKEQARRGRGAHVGRVGDEVWREKNRARRMKERATAAGWAQMTVRRARERSKREGFPFDLVPADITVPTHCPDLGMALVFHAGGKGRPRNLATLDRIDPAKGYVRGNVRVISNRANVLKSDATCAELAAVLAGMIKVGAP